MECAILYFVGSQNVFYSFPAELVFCFIGVATSLWTRFKGFDYRSISEWQGDIIFFPHFVLLNSECWQGSKISHWDRFAIIFKQSGDILVLWSFYFKQN